MDWLDSFPNTKITNLPAFASDHVLMLLSIGGQGMNSKVHDFRFQEAYVEHTDFLSVVEKAWKKGQGF